MASLKNLMGQTFNRLTVVARGDNVKRGRATWVCKCECGNEVTVRGADLIRGHTNSCGCFSIDKAKERYGPKHPNWKGGKRLKNGYVLIYFPSHLRADKDGCVRENVLVLEKKLGRPIKEGFVAHHRDGNRQNDDPDNLEEMAFGEHSRYHNTGERCPTSKLKEEDVRAIRAAQNRTLESLAKEYGVNFSHVGYIRRGQRWKHVE